MLLLTGGAGFIGSCLLKKLNVHGINDIVVVDRLGYSDKWKNLTGKKFKEFIHKDNFLEGLRQGLYNLKFNAIIHLGACTVTTERNADYVIENNLNYSIELAEFAAENNIKFIYASSAATYGAGEKGYNDLVFEQLRPLNVYGMSKLLFDLWVIDKELDKKFTGLKFFNVFGPNEYHKDDMASMIFKAFKQIQEIGKVKLFKSEHPDYQDGEQKRDFIYVKDVCDIIFEIYKQSDFTGIYNLGTGSARTWNDLINAVFQAMDRDSNIEYIDMPESLKNQYQYFTRAEMDKLLNKLDYKFPKLEDSVSDYVRNYLMKDWKYL